MGTVSRSSTVNRWLGPMHSLLLCPTLIRGLECPRSAGESLRTSFSSNSSLKSMALYAQEAVTPCIEHRFPRCRIVSSGFRRNASREELHQVSRNDASNKSPSMVASHCRWKDHWLHRPTWERTRACGHVVECHRCRITLGHVSPTLQFAQRRNRSRYAAVPARMVVERCPGQRRSRTVLTQVVCYCDMANGYIVGLDVAVIDALLLRNLKASNRHSPKRWRRSSCNLPSLPNRRAKRFYAWFVIDCDQHRSIRKPARLPISTGLMNRRCWSDVALKYFAFTFDSIVAIWIDCYLEDVLFVVLLDQQSDARCAFPKRCSTRKSPGSSAPDSLRQDLRHRFRYPKSSLPARPFQGDRGSHRPS